MSWRVAFGTPCSLRPNSALSITLSHGSSACFWNTTPRSAPGPQIFSPPSSNSPCVGEMKPAISESKVVLPQPDAPSATTKSPELIVRLMSSSACTDCPAVRPGKTTLTFLTLMLSIVPPEVRRRWVRGPQRSLELHRGIDIGRGHEFRVIGLHGADLMLLLQKRRCVFQRKSRAARVAAAEPLRRSLFGERRIRVKRQRCRYVGRRPADGLRDGRGLRRRRVPGGGVLAVLLVRIGDRLHEFRHEVLMILSP